MADNQVTPFNDDSDEESEEEVKPFKERAKDVARNVLVMTVYPLTRTAKYMSMLFFRAAPPKPTLEVQELMTSMGLMPLHLQMMYKTFHKIGNIGQSETLSEMDVVPRSNLVHLIRTRQEWCWPILLALAELGGCIKEDEDDPDEEVMMTWDDFLYVFLRFNSLTRVELAQFMFMCIVKQLQAEPQGCQSFQYLTDVELDKYYERFRVCTIPSFAPRDVWFKHLELRRYYASDFVEITQRYWKLLSPCVHLQRELRWGIPTLDFWDNFDHETSYNRKLTMEFFMIRKTHCFLRGGEPPLRETCDLLLPSAMGYDPVEHYSHPLPPKVTLAAREAEANRQKAVAAKKKVFTKPDPMSIPMQLRPVIHGAAGNASLGRSQHEQTVKTVNGRIQPPELNKRPDVHPDTVGKSLSLSLKRAAAQQKYENHVQTMQFQLQMNMQQHMGGKESRYAVKGKDGGNQASAMQAPPKKIRQPPPVASVDLPRWMRDVPLKYLPAFEGGR